MEIVPLLFLLLSLAASSTQAYSIPHHIHLLRPKTGSSGHHRTRQLNCLSWRLAVETNNLRGWKLVPEACEGYVGHYMLGKQYREDCNLVADSAIEYAKILNLPKDGKNIWVFDIDETALSNLPYYARSDVAFGATLYNETKFDEWVAEGKAPAVPGSVRLYKTLLSLGIKAVFLTGTAERFRDVRVSNLKAAGFYKWEKLILKGDRESSSSGVVYKSAKRREIVKAGYRIVGNIGDQWSDLLGDHVGNRTFKLPDPMYYIA